MQKIARHLFLTAIVFKLYLVSFANAQTLNEQGFLPASSSFNRQRFVIAVTGEATVATLTTIGLEYLWYKKFPHSHFHFFNDNDEWLNMDKAGHATTAYNIEAFQYNVMRWAGVKKDASRWISAGTAFAFMTMIEISDGFSKQWGFSTGDMIANVSGILFFTGQQSLWNQQKILLQYSFHKTIFPKYNPDELGRNLPQQMLKDYNGQRYWLSFNVSSFFKDNIPKWLTVDFGYGATGMTGATSNQTEFNGKSIPSFKRERELFFSVDGAFTANKNITYPSWLNIFRIPTPPLQYNINENKFQFQLLPR